MAVMEREAIMSLETASSGYLRHAREEYDRIAGMIRQVEESANDGTAERLAASLKKLKMARANLRCV